MGEKGLFEELVQNNLKLFEKYQIKKIVTSCPHAFNAFKNRYGEKPNYEVQHHTQLVAKLIDEGKIKFTKEIPKSIAYQDSCFLGRWNGVYDEPRKIIQSIPGVNFIELERSRERSLCCEGGGGRMWFDVEAPEHLSEIRVKETIEAGAEILATACPFCMVNLEDAVKTTDSEDKLKIMDIAELVVQAL